VRWVKSGTAAFGKTLEEVCNRGSAVSEKVSAAVSETISRIRKEGDAALADYTRRFDGFDPLKKGFAVTRREIDAAWRRTPQALKKSLSFAASRIEAFHGHQVQTGYIADIPGAILGQRVIPVSRAGVYVPGGKAAYPSTLLMNSIPARVANVKEVIAAVPAPGGKIPDVVLAAARIAELSGVFKIGGAQAIAAMAFGTESVPKVEVIAGPGNAYVTEAKRQVFGVVGIDMLAGPSELVVLADGSANPSYVAADLLSQAEHDEDAFVALVTDSAALSRKVEAELLRQAGKLRRKKIVSISLAGALGFLVRGMKEGISTVNSIAPEHLSIMVENPWSALEGIRNAGTAFLGPYSPVAVGDYVAGINHTLPTGGAAAFSSPLGVSNFIKRMNVVSYQIRALTADAPHVARLAGREGLDAHARAVLKRIDREA
jgi:histidinol dehydrogenase